MKYKDKVWVMHHARRFVWTPGQRRGFYQPTMNFFLFGQSFRYRYDPVPHTGGTGKVYILPGVRHMKTTQELRWYYAHKEYVRIRGRRTPKQLPNLWNDFWHGRREKGWKRTKKKRQWM